MDFPVTTALFVIIACSVRFSAGWSYDTNAADGPPNWAITYSTCGGQNQSPINIQNWNAQRVSYSAWNFSNYVLTPGATFTLVNNGHTAEVMVENAQFQISGGGLGNTYTLEQLHFHWGANNNRGSDHYLNNNDYPLELHLVHYNSDLYADVASAKGDPTGLAVLGIVVQSSSGTTAQLKTIASYFPQIQHSGDQVGIDPFEITTLLPSNTNQFYRYSGSLTTPDCSECVVWTVFYNGLSIANTDIAAFRGLFSNVAGDPDTALQDNFRPTQKLNSRTVYKSSN